MRTYLPRALHEVRSRARFPLGFEGVAQVTECRHQRLREMEKPIKVLQFVTGF
jgi:hypothetical protein